jgi:hypothetical protein
MNKSWGNPIHNGLDLIRIYVNTIFINNIPKEFDFGLMEFASLQLNIESNFSELVQNKSNILFMFLHVLGKNEDIINVKNHEVIQIFI